MQRRTSPRELAHPGSIQMPAYFTRWTSGNRVCQLPAILFQDILLCLAGKRAWLVIKASRLAGGLSAPIAPEFSTALAANGRAASVWSALVLGTCSA